MARKPPKTVRFLVWILSSSENREDVLTAFDELFGKTYESFGPFYAHLWALSQVLRSTPYWVWGTIIKIGSHIWKTG